MQIRICAVESEVMSAVYDCLVPVDDKGMEISLKSLHYATITIRPHHCTTYVDAAYHWRPSSVVCRYVCRSVT